MKRLIQTSTGPALLDLDRFGQKSLGLGVAVTRFGHDGWEQPGNAWFENSAQQSQTLAQFLAVELEVPGPEAAALADDILGPWVKEWELRGGEAWARKVGRITAGAMTGLAIVILLACLGVGLLVWLLVS